MNEKPKSLKTKIFYATLQITAVVLLVVLVANYLLFTGSITDHYNTMANENALTVAHMVSKDDVEDVADQVWELYRYYGPREKSNQIAFNRVLESESYQNLVKWLRTYRDDQNLTYLGVMICDLENARFIYLADADAIGTEKYPASWPGEALLMSDTELKALSNNRFAISAYRSDHGLDAKSEEMTSAVQAIISPTHGSGILAYVMVDIEMTAIRDNIEPYVLQATLVFLVLVFLLASYVVFVGNKYVIKPINSLSIATRQFIAGRRHSQRSDGYFKSLGINTRDEIEEMARSMSVLEHDLNNYEDEIIVLTKDSERIHTELSLANSIQEHMLPSTFPPFPERDDVDIYAIMRPAREVGGDFYDLFLIDEHHLALVVADVSGKGVPAALFMMISKTLIKNSLKLEFSPAKVLEQVNNLLCENNGDQMFVTVWLAIVDLRNGDVVYANGGHENPLLYQDGCWTYITTKHGLVLSAMEAMTYTDYHLTLKPGDWLFQYSDGVPEATSKAMELYGDDRLLQTVSTITMADTTSFLKALLEDIDTFVDGGEQFDDITMLAFRYTRKEVDENGNH